MLCIHSQHVACFIITNNYMQVNSQVRAIAGIVVGGAFVIVIVVAVIAVVVYRRCLHPDYEPMNDD